MADFHVVQLAGREPRTPLEHGSHHVGAILDAQPRIPTDLADGRKSKFICLYCTMLTISSGTSCDGGWHSVREGILREASGLVDRLEIMAMAANNA